MTSDVDAFIMTNDILDPLEMSSKQIWLYQYIHTLNTGSTLPMSFIAMKALVWREILEYDSSLDKPEIGVMGNGLEKMVEHYGKKMNFPTASWGTDQNIISYAIMSSGFCSLPKMHSLWQHINLVPRSFDDQNTCWHGDVGNCNINNALLNCQWWHFTPHQTVTDLQKKFREIMNQVQK